MIRKDVNEYIHLRLPRHLQLYSSNLLTLADCLYKLEITVDLKQSLVVPKHLERLADLPRALVRINFMPHYIPRELLCVKLQFILFDNLFQIKWSYEYINSTHHYKQNDAKNYIIYLIVVQHINFAWFKVTRFVNCKSM